MKPNIKPKSSIIYNGPSLIDGAPIVVICITSSSNRKTGDLLQTYILRADVDPSTANRTGQDVSICGDCLHRGTPDASALTGWAKGRTCYVNLGQGPRAIYASFQAGKYPSAETPEERQRMGSGRMLRIGSYGDPLAVPAHVWQELTSKATGWTSYTHQHDRATPADYKRSMASADTKEQAQAMHAKGLRTFRVIPVRVWKEQGTASMLESEILCPASKEATEARRDGSMVECSSCKLCKGSSIKAKSIAIPAHGPTATRYTGHAQ